MVSLTTLQTSFASGEVDPGFHGQRNLKAYAEGAKRLRNVARRSTGGVERRFGTHDLNELAGDARLESFEFSDTQRYVIAFTPGQVEIFDVNGERLELITGAPWDVAQIEEMTTTQNGDIMVICHTGFYPRVLGRIAGDNFELVEFGFDLSFSGLEAYQPYYKFARASVTLKPSAATGAITLTASADQFTADDVGQRYRIYGAEVLITAVTDATHASATVYGTLKGKLDLDALKTTKGSTVVEVTHLYHGLKTGQPISLTGCNDCGGIPSSYLNVAGKSVTVLDEHRYTIDVGPLTFDYWEDHDGDGTPSKRTYSAARTSEDGGGGSIEFVVANCETRNWAEPAMSPRRGYPGACSFHDGRLWFMGMAGLPDGAAGSSALQPYRFDLGKGLDADAVFVAIGSEDTSRIRHAISAGDLHCFTATTESSFQVREGEAVTPANARIKAYSNTGCSMVQPAVFDGATLFCQENGLALFEYLYSESENGFISTPVSTLAAHLIRNPRKLAASNGTTSRAEQFCFLVNADGTLTVFHSMRRENIAGFVLWTLGEGRFRSVTTVGPYVFFAVEVRGTYRLYRLAQEDSACLDGCVVHTSGAAKTEWVLDARVRSRTVHLVSDKGYHGELLVPADGLVTLDVAVSSLTAGDAFYPEVETLPPAVALPSGERSGKIKRLVKTVIDFDGALAATVDGQPLPLRDASEAWDTPVRAWTGPFETTHLGFDRDPTVTISQSAPLAPWGIRSVLQEVAV